SPTPGKAKGAETARQTYVVQRGDTLASISRKFYKTSTRWKQILDANRNVIDNPKKLVVGQTLVIPARTTSHQPSKKTEERRHRVDRAMQHTSGQRIESRCSRSGKQRAW